MRFFSEDLLRLAGRAAEHRRYVFAAREALRAERPNWNAGSDARIVLLNKCHNIAKSAELSLAFVGCYLLDSNWWTESHHDPIDMNTIGVVVMEYTQFAKIGFLHQFFGAFDASLRIFLRYLNPNAVKGSTGSFNTVCTVLLSKELPGLSSFLPLLDLFRLTRNTVHNNGMVFTPGGTDAEVKWGGRTYVFPHEKYVEFVTWDFLFDRGRELVDLAVAIVRHPRLSAPLSSLDDPGAYPPPVT